MTDTERTSVPEVLGILLGGTLMAAWIPGLLILQWAFGS